MITVIVVTYNRWKLLAECLESLLSQDFEKRYEIVLIDNGSLVEAETCIKKYVHRGIRYIRLPCRQSVEQCKRLGIEESKGEEIAFIDDDCIATAHWLRNIDAALVAFDIVGGPVLPVAKTKFPHWWQDSLSWLVGINRSPGITFLPLGSNIAFRKHVLLAMQGDEKVILRNKGYYPPYAEDNYRLKKALESGFSMHIIKTMVVFHYVPQDRLTLRYFLKRSYEEGKALARWEHSPRKLLSALSKLCADPIRLIIERDINRLFRMIVRGSYLIHYLRLCCW